MSLIICHSFYQFHRDAFLGLQTLPFLRSFKAITDFPNCLLLFKIKYLREPPVETSERLPLSHRLLGVRQKFSWVEGTKQQLEGVFDFALRAQSIPVPGPLRLRSSLHPSSQATAPPGPRGKHNRVPKEGGLFSQCCMKWDLWGDLLQDSLGNAQTESLKGGARGRSFPSPSHFSWQLSTEKENQLCKLSLSF